MSEPIVTLAGSLCLSPGLTSMTLLVSPVQFPALRRASEKPIQGVSQCQAGNTQQGIGTTWPCGLGYLISMSKTSAAPVQSESSCVSHFFFYLCASLSVTGDVGRGKDKVRFPASQTSEVQKAVGPGDKENERKRRGTEVPGADGKAQHPARGYGLQ